MADEAAKRESLRLQARAMMQARPSSVLKDKMEMDKLQADMFAALEFVDEDDDDFKPEPEPTIKKAERLKLELKLPNGDLEKITIAADDTVPDIKEVVEDDHDIPIEEQQLFHKGKPLVDLMADLKDLGIQTGDVIEVNPPPIEIFIKSADGKKLAMKVPPHITIYKLKHQIQDEHGMEADETKLEFNGKSLKDMDATLTFDCGVSPGDSIDAKAQDVEVDVRLYTGKKKSVTLPPTATIGELKKKVKKAHDIPVDEQELEFDGKPLSDDKATLMSCGIKNGAVIDMKAPDIKISVVKHDGKKLSLTVKPTFTVRDLKQLIQEKHDIPVEKQELEFEGNPLADASATLEADYGIKAKSKIDMMALAMTVFVATADGSKLTISVKPTTTVAQLSAKLHFEHEISPDSHYLEFKDKALDNPDATLEELKIKADKTIDLRYKDITVTAIEPSGTNIDVKIAPSANLFDLQMQIQKSSVLALEDYLMMFDGHALPDDGTISLAECGIGNGAFIKLDPRPVGIVIENHDGTEIELSVSPQETVQAVIDILLNEYVIDLQEKNQTMYFNDEPLDDPESPLDAYGIVGGSRLFLDEPDMYFEVMVVPGGDFLEVALKTTDALYYLKQKIQEELKIPFRSQGIRIDGKKDLSATNPEATLKECEIEDGDVVIVENVPDITIEIRINDTDGRKKKTTMPIKVKHFYTVESLQLQLHEDFKIPRKEQVLKYDMIDLDDPMRTFKALGIGDGSIVDLHPWHIHVKTEEGDMLAVVLSPEATVYELEERIEGDHKIPAKKQSLSYQGVELKDPAKLLSEYEVKFGTIVDLTLLKKEKKVGEKPKKKSSEEIFSPKSKKRSSVKSKSKSSSKKRESLSKSDRKDKKDKKKSKD